MNFKARLLLALLLATSSNAFADDLRSKLEQIKASHQKVGLVLSGGGARGFAHIGVLRALEAEGIKVSYITGTSMGALIGAAYASGMTPDEIEDFVESDAMKSAFTDIEGRNLESMQKKQAELNSSSIIKLGINKDGPVASQGLIQGQNVERLIRGIFYQNQKTRTFNDLNIPFKAVSTNLETGTAVVLEKGDLPKALRATISIPDFFAPVEIDNKLLIDGGLSNNLPIDVAKSMGADVVIAVDISTPLAHKKALTNPASISKQLVVMMTYSTVTKQKSYLDKDDILVTPDLSTASTLNFNDPTTIINAGWKSVMGDEPIPKKHSSAEAAKPLAIHYDKLVINNHTVLSSQKLEELLQLPERGDVSLNTLENKIQATYAQLDLRLIDYQLKQDNDQQQLIINVYPHQPAPLNIAVDLKTEINPGRFEHSYFDFSGRIDYSLNHEGTSKAGVDITLGNQQLIEANYSYEFLDQQLIFNAAVGSMGKPAYEEVDSDDTADWWLKNNYFKTSLSYTLDHFNAFSLQLQQQELSSELENGQSPQTNYSDKNINVRVGYTFDSLDNSIIPTDGQYVNLGYQHYLDGDADGGYFVSGVAKAYTTVDRHTVGVQALYQAYNDTPDSYAYASQIGGYQNLSALPYNELTMPVTGMARIDYRYRINNLLFPVRLPIYLGLNAEIGGGWKQKEDINYHTSAVSGGFSISSDTPIGAVSVGYGRSNQDDNLMYISFGMPEFTLPKN